MKNEEFRMKNLLRLEELAQFAVCLFALITFHPSWWCYLLLAIGPDIGMLGYLVNSKVGAITYNLLHHKGLAILVLALGALTSYLRMITDSPETAEQAALVVGIMLYGHASMDRIFGYGLKFGDSFQHTHLGWIGKSKEM